MKKLLALLIALMTVLLCSCSSGGETIRFGAAGTGGIYNEAVNSIKSIADADGTLKIETKTTIDSQLDFLLQMYCHGSIEMTKSWVEKNMYLDIETLVNMLIESMPERLKQYINL